MKKIALALLLGSVCYSSLLLATPPIKSAPSQQTIEQITQLAQKVIQPHNIFSVNAILKVMAFLKILKSLPNGLSRRVIKAMQTLNSN